MAGTNDEQVIELLREIRDVQKEHFERSREYTERILELEKQRELERQRLEQSRRAEIRRMTHGVWVILLVAMLLIFFLRPFGNWIQSLFSD